MNFKYVSSISFSIITPVYNREDCILRCLESVSVQNYEKIEHVVIDDGSTDSTYDKITSFSSNKKHVTTLKLKNNCGPNVARNKGINIAKNEIILFLDSDDELLPNALNIVASVLQTQKFIKCFLFLNSDKVEKSCVHPILKKGSQVFYYKMFLDNTINFSLDFSYVFYKKDCLRYPFNENLRIYEGISYLNIFRKNRVLFYSNIAIIKREINRDDSVSYENYLFTDKRMKDALLYYEEIIKHYNMYLNNKLIFRQRQKINYRIKLLKLILFPCFIKDKRHSQKKSFKLFVVHKIIYLLLFPLQGMLKTYGFIKFIYKKSHAFYWKNI